MEYSDLSRLYSLSSQRVRDISLQYFRHLMSRIDWENRLILLMGARGTGKTTMLLQRIKTAFSDSQEAL